MSEKRQKNQIELAFTYSSKGEALRDTEEGTEALVAKVGTEDPTGSQRLMEAVCETENLKRALRRVKANKGSPGVDGMRVDQLPRYLIGHWKEIREELLSGTYKAQPVRRVEIPKADGGSERLASRRRWIDSFSRKCCRCCRSNGTRRSQSTVTASDRNTRNMGPSQRRSSIKPKGMAG